jgi:hypothetical protein
MSDHEARGRMLPEDAALRAIVEGVEAEIGDQFFASVVRQLASALDAQCAFVSGPGREGKRVADALAPASPHSTAVRAMPSAPATRSPGRRHTG